MLPLSSSSSPILSPLLMVASSSSQQPSASSDCLSVIEVMSPLECDISAPIVHNVVLSEPICKSWASKIECEHNEALVNLNKVINYVCSNMDLNLRDDFEDKLKKCTLDIKDLFLAVHLLRNDVAQSKAVIVINNFIKEIGKRCVTDQDKENALLWIPDGIKCRTKIMQYFHMDTYVNIASLMNGDIDLSLVSESLKIFCLYVSRKLSRRVLGKYKNRLPDSVFEDLCLFINQTLKSRTRCLLSAIEYIQTVTNVSINFIAPVKDSAEVGTKVSKEAVYVKSVKYRIGIVRQNRRTKKRQKKSYNKVEEIKRSLLSGSLPLNDIIESRKFLLTNGISSDQVHRWFRAFLGKVCKSISISNEDKRRVIDKIDESKDVCKSFIKDIYDLDEEVVSMINSIKLGTVVLSDLKNVRGRLIKEIGADKTSRMFLGLKRRLLKNNPERAFEIDEAFKSAKQRDTYELGNDDKELMQSFKDGAVAITTLKESFDRLASIRKRSVVKSIICNYVKKAIASGVQPSQILPHLPAHIRASDSLIMSCNLSHAYIIRALKYGSLPFARLEEAARIAADYFTPYVLFGILLRYGYFCRKFSAEDKRSFKLLLSSLEVEGLISVYKECNAADGFESDDITKVERPVYSSFLELLEQPGTDQIAQGQSDLGMIYFEDRLDNIMVVSGIDADLQQVFEPDSSESFNADSRLIYDVDMAEHGLLYEFCD